MFVPNRKHTVEHLHELKDEVKDLHPVLHALFGKMPGIERVHYNQGNNELGADFILYKRDSALLRTTCVGVVVKVGSIRQNTAEVDRQIDECFIPRKAVDGVEIQIREVWVVSSHDITKNARDVLSKKYKDKKIEFISSQDLATLIDNFAPDAFVTASPALQIFAENLTSSLTAEDQRSLVVPGMESFYVDPKIIRKDFDGYGNLKTSKKVQDLDELLSLLKGSQFSIVQAGAGGGKSKLARELVKKVIATQEFSDGNLFPVIGHAKNYVDDCKLAMADRISSFSIDVGCHARAIFFIDGFAVVSQRYSNRFNWLRESSAISSSTLLASS